MTALDTSTQIPSNIDTVERIFSWAALALHDLNRGFYYKETDDALGSVPVITAGLVEAADGTDRLIVRAAIPMNVDWRSDGTKKLWEFSDNIKDDALPAAFTTN